MYAINYGCFFMRERVPGGNGGDIKGEYIGQCNVNGYFDPTWDSSTEFRFAIYHEDCSLSVDRVSSGPVPGRFLSLRSIWI